MNIPTSSEAGQRESANEPQPLLTTPLRIRGHELRNRIVMPAMVTDFASDEGRVTDRICTYYAARARTGAVGLMVCEHAFVQSIGRLSKHQLGIESDDAVDGLRRLACAMHATPDAHAGAGADASVGANAGDTVGDVARGAATVALCQLSHAGGAADYASFELGLVAPSAIIHPGRRRSGNSGIVPRALTRDEIAGLVGDFAAAARRAMEAGFDGVEVHAAHGYLLHQFFSPVTNHRDDEYGPACVENRARVICEVLREVRRAVGDEAILAVRIGGSDYVEGGSTIGDAVEASRLYEAAGADIIDVSGGIYNFSTHVLKPPGFFRDASSAIHAQVGVPVITTGAIRTAEDAEWLLQEGAADLVGIGRPLMRQPQWAARELEHFERGIRACRHTSDALSKSSPASRDAR